MKRKNILRQEKIKSLIKESDYSFKEIAKMTGAHINTVYNINLGRTHHDNEECYPLRSRDGDRVRRLIEKLSVPSTAAVPNSHIITPYVLDYISMLSFLKVDISCLLVFKEIYEKDVISLMGESLSDKELINLFHMRPQKPDKLRILIEVYDNPTLTLDILKYWEQSGFLSKEEAKDVFKIFIKI